MYVYSYPPAKPENINKSREVIIITLQHNVQRTLRRVFFSQETNNARAHEKRLRISNLPTHGQEISANTDNQLFHHPSAKVLTITLPKIQ